MDDRLRDLERRALQGDGGAAAQLGRERCRVGEHGEAVWMPVAQKPGIVGGAWHIGLLVIGCPRCARLAEADDDLTPETLDAFSRALEVQRELAPDLVACSLCAAVVHRDDVCSTEACRRCHRTVSFDDCVGGATGI